MTREEIEEAQRDLQDTMSRVFPETHRPDTEFPYCHNGTYWYRAGYRPGGNGTTACHLNGFGTVRDGIRPPATVEINVAEEGRKNGIGGFFARDMGSGTVYLMHAGWLNPGGYAFRDWLGQKQFAALDGRPEPRQGFIVVATNGSTGDHSLIRYIESIVRFREADDEVPDDPAQFRPFYQEPRGWRVADNPGVVEYARSETVLEKPTFQDAFRQRRCVIPVNGWFEWVRENGQKTPYWIRPEATEVFSLAGIWESGGTSPGAVGSFVILTRQAAPGIADIHHRQPVILEGEGLEAWLKPGWGSDRLIELARVGGGWSYERRGLSREVNDPVNDWPELLVPAQAVDQFGFAAN